MLNSSKSKFVHVCSFAMGNNVVRKRRQNCSSESRALEVESHAATKLRSLPQTPQWPLYATSDKCITTSNKKLLGARGIATRSKNATGAPGLTTRSKKLLVTKGIATRHGPAPLGPSRRNLQRQVLDRGSLMGARDPLPPEDMKQLKKQHIFIIIYRKINNIFFSDFFRESSFSM